MAEYLLNGGKMLAKTCPSCNSPLFEWKDETLCVVCREEKEEEISKNGGDTREYSGEEPRKPGRPAQGDTDFRGTLETEFAQTIATLLSRARDEQDMRRLSHLLSAVKKASQAYAILSH